MRGLFNWISQVLAVTRLSLSTILERKGSSAATVFGVAGVVAVMVSVLSIAQGFWRTMNSAALPENVIILRSGSDSEMMSILTVEDTRVIADTAGIARKNGLPAASPELFVVINLPKRSTGTDANVPLRGVLENAFVVHEEARILEGRRFEPGKNEIIAGYGASREFSGLDLGAKIKVGRNEWTVVGIFEANGGLAESEIWTDAAVLQAAYQRGNSFQTVHVKLESPEGFNAFKDRLTTDPRLSVKAQRQSEYYAEQSEMITNMIRGLGAVISVLMGIGAVFGALNTMYSAVSARAREIATLRALGFGGLPVVISVLLEALALALAGGLIGGVLAYALFDGYRAATLNWQSFSQVAFAFAVTPALLVQGIVYSVIIGLIGGFFPAIRAARLPVATALREL